jgi:hypothetical protein
MSNPRKREDGLRQIIIGLFFLSVFVLIPSLTHALSLREALEEAAIYFTNTAVKIDPNKKMVIQVVNYHSQKQDTDARKIETELYFALEKQFPNYKLVLLSEVLAGLSGRGAVFVKGTYEKQGEKTIVRLQALQGMSGIILAQTMVGFETKKLVRRTLVAVMDIEASDIKPNQRKAYSEIFRSALIRSDSFNLASSSDIDKLNPDAIQKATGCTRDECATIIGEQLGVDRSISTTLLKLDQNSYILSSKILDIKDGSILTAKTLEHKGGLDTIKDSLEELAKGLVEETAKSKKVIKPIEVTPKPILIPSNQTAMLVVKSIPTEANIMLDGQHLKEKTNALLQNLSIGKHELTVFKGNLGATQTVILVPDKTEEIRLELKMLKTEFQIQSTPPALLYIDGQNMGNTPVTVKIEVGDHELELRRNEYQTLKESIQIKPFVLNKLNSRLVPFSEVEITSAPVGATVVIDGIQVGKTPLTVKSSPGKEEIIFHLDGYQDLKKMATIKPYANARVEAQLVKLINLTVSYSPPSAMVVIDGNRVNESEVIDLNTINDTRKVTVSLPVGSHQIEVTHAGTVKNFKTSVDLKIRDSEYREEAFLQIEPDYLNQIYESEYSEWMRVEYTPWLWKFGGSLTGAAILAYLVTTEMEKAADSKSKQDDAEKAMLAASTYSEAKEYSDSAASYNDEIKEGNKNKNMFMYGSAIFFGASIYYFLNKPEIPDRNHSLWPHLDSGEKLRLAYQYRW